MQERQRVEERVNVLGHELNQEHLRHAKMTESTMDSEEALHHTQDKLKEMEGKLKEAQDQVEALKTANEQQLVESAKKMITVEEARTLRLELETKVNARFAACDQLALEYQ